MEVINEMRKKRAWLPSEQQKKQHMKKQQWLGIMKGNDNNQVLSTTELEEQNLYVRMRHAYECS